jgi:hypothetical protein
MKWNNAVVITAVAMALLATPVWSAQKPVAAKPLSVNQLAAKPEAYAGKLAVIGRVATATPGKGFTLVDSGNCATCTTDCLTDKGTKKIPFLWVGAAPVVKEVVRVDGALAKTAKGYTFTAERVTKQ